MEEIDKYILTSKEYNKLSALSNNLYNTAVVIRYFCKNQPENEEIAK